MDQQGVTQSEPAQELGSQGVVSEIVSGKREMNLNQMRDMAIRFSVPVTTFAGGASVALAATKGNHVQARSADQLLAGITAEQGLVAHFGDSRESTNCCRSPSAIDVIRKS